MEGLENANPEVFEAALDRETLPEEEDDDVQDEIDAREIFGLLNYTDMRSRCHT